MHEKKGKVWLVGAGPGDAGLFTIKGNAVLQQADVIVYDKLVGDGVLALMPESAEKIFVGKVAGNHAVPQEEINRILLREAKKGKRVVRLKGGDPFVFGRGGEELELLVAEDIPFEIVPGITSAVSVPAYNGIPVTHRDFVSSLHIITGHTKKSDAAEVNYKALVCLEGTLVFLMGVSAMPSILKGLLDAGMDKNMPAAILERGTRAHQRRVVGTISDLTEEAAKAEIKTPAIIIVGKVCSLAEQFHWAEDRPLGGLKIAVTRPQNRNSYLADKLAYLGAEVVLIPSIKTIEIEDNSGFVREIDRINDYKWIVFTSPEGVEIFFKKLTKVGMDIRGLGSIKFAAIGSATKAAIQKRNVMVELMPDIYSGFELGKLLAEKIMQEDKQGQETKVLIPRAKIGTDEVTKPLEEKNILYYDLPLYDTITAENFELDEEVDYVTFTSASTVSGFVELSKLDNFSGIKALCIGEKTAEEAAKYGMNIILSKTATMDSMIDCLLELKNSNKKSV